jgi:hypothetical protein
LNLDSRFKIEINIFDFFVQIRRTLRNKWFHGPISQSEAERKLAEVKMSGAFLVRFSSQNGKYTLSRVGSNGQIVHIRISYSSMQNQFVLEGAKIADMPVCPTLEKLVRWISGPSFNMAVGGSIYESIEGVSGVYGGYDDFHDD